MQFIDCIQSSLNFQGWTGVQFRGPKSIGKIGVALFILGSVLGVHIALGKVSCISLYYVPEQYIIWTGLVNAPFHSLFFFFFFFHLFFHHDGIFDSYDISLTFCFCILQGYWCFYVIMLCTFHFLEFFMTAMYQPNSLSYDCKWI